MNSLEGWKDLNARAVALCHLGMFSKAVDVAVRALKFAQSTFGDNHHNVSESLENMGLIYYSQGKYFENLLSEQTSSWASDKITHPDHPDDRQCQNNLVLCNLAKRKYGEAESFLRQALAIKEKTHQPGQPELMKTLEYLSQVCDSQGKGFEAECLIESLRSTDLKPSKGCQTTGMEWQSVTSMDDSCRRRHVRFRSSFRAELSGAGSVTTASGIAENLSQGGAFIKTENWHTFKIYDQVSVTIFVPPPFPDQDPSIGLQSMARVVRIDDKDEGIAIQFIDDHSQRESTEGLEIAGKARYKRLAHYLTAPQSFPLAGFEKGHPNGFLVERVRNLLDKNVVFQFDTLQVDEPGVANHPEKTTVLTAVLEARVIEAKKRKATSPPNIVTIGRAATNDIVLYNKMVSKSHACLYLPPGNESLCLVDLASTNGTFLNGERLKLNEDYELAEGDEISFGPQTKVIYLSAKGFYDLLGSIECSC